MSSDPYRLRTTDRGGLPPSVTYIIVGFRCATTRTPRHSSAVRKLGTNQAHYRGRQCAVNRTNATAPQLVQAEGLVIIVVAPRGIEPRTQRFSVSCSTY